MVVDVGGGIGTSSIAIAQNVPAVRCIVQDRLATVAAGMQVTLTGLQTVSG